jgi:hypothetical protein
VGAQNLRASAASEQGLRASRFHFPFKIVKIPHGMSLAEGPVVAEQSVWFCDQQSKKPETDQVLNR